MQFMLNINIIEYGVSSVYLTSYYEREEHCWCGKCRKESFLHRATKYQQLKYFHQIIHTHNSSKMKSSLPYQLLLYLGSYYFGCYIIIEILVLLYKSIILPYKSLTLFSEVNIDVL